MHHIKPKVTKTGNKQRSGKGFSQEELKKAGINKTEAKKLEIPIDKRRKTAHDQNVKTIKTYAANKKKAKAKPKPKPQPKKKAKK
jgi:ribosomal protein L13E